MAGGPRLEWDSGTAYDFFVSLFVLHRPEEFGLRASWAAGVRSRLSEDTRKLMADVQHFAGVPGHWVPTLPQPKDSRIALSTLEAMDPADVARVLVAEPGGEDDPAHDIVYRVLERGSWSAADVDTLMAHKMDKPKGRQAAAERTRLERWLDWVSRPADLGRGFVRGMAEYREAFFREDERRIAPALAHAVSAGQERARTLAPADLLEELTRGLRITALLDSPRLLLVPSFWCSPRIVYGRRDKDTLFVIYSARPADVPLVPGDAVPDALTTALAALADPTRLNTLKLLRKEALTQAEIARRLRLRAPTISHHINALRIAGLITFLDSEGSERRYAARAPGIEDTCASLRRFLEL